MLRGFIVGLTLVAALALGAGTSPAAAQSGPICSKFDAGKDGWGPCSWAPNVVVTTATTGGIGTNDPYLQITDKSGASAVCSSDPKYLGNWVDKMGGCGQLCFDFKVFSSGIPPSAVTPSFSIYSGANKATFYANFQVAIGDTSWHRNICAPVMLGSGAPPSPNGHWVISGGTWNSIITNVTMMSIPIDFSSSPSEVVGYDNICMSPGGCGEKPKEEITGCLKDSKVEVKCNPDGTYTLTLSGAGTPGDVLTLVAQTSGVTVSPAQQPWAATTTWTINGAAPGQLVALTANASKVGGGSLPGTDQCCSGEIKISMPECEKKPPIDLKVEKENTPSGGQGNGFNVWVTNVGAPITFAPGQLTVKDVVPAGLTISTQSSTKWTCNPLPAIGLATITCTYNLSGTLGTNAQLTDSLVFNGVLTDKKQPLKNCAIVSIPATVGVDTNSSNDEACVTVSGGDGSLTVKKEVINNTSIPVPASSVYAISASCASGMSPAVVTAMPLINGGSQTVTPLALNTVCTITETPPTPPSTGPVSCGAPGSTLAWTTVLPAPVTVTGPGMTATVQNILNCIPPGGQLGTLIVTKTVLNKTQGQVSTAGLHYPFSVSCASGGSPAVVSTFNITENSSYTVSNIALNSSCTVTEGTMPAATGTCATGGAVPTWALPPTITPASPVPVNGTTVTVTVLNTMECKIPGQHGYYRVTKTIDNQTSNTDAYLNGLVFPTTSTCDGNAVSLNVQRMVPGIVTNIPAGAVCSVVETLPPAPSSGCPAGKVATWGAPVYAPATVTIASGAGPVIQMTNVLTCEAAKKLTPQACKPPLVAGARPGECVCPAGLTKKGARCVEALSCRSPQKLNKAGTACLCPDGMTKRGNSCVEKERERPRDTPNDVIRVLPGLIGPGGFGGGRGEPRGGGGGSGKSPGGP